MQINLVKLLALLLCWAVLNAGARTRAAELEPQSAMPELGPLSQKVLAAYMAYGAGDLDSLVALTAPDVSWGGIGPADFGAPFGMYSGHEGVRRWFRELAADAAQYELTGLEFHEDATTVTVTGQHATTFRATGRMVRGPFVHVFWVRDGLISQYWNCVDAAQIMEGAGRGAAAPAAAMAPDPGIATVQAAYDAFYRGDMERLLGYMTDDIRWELVGPAGQLRIFGRFAGKAQVLQWFSDLQAAASGEPFMNTRFISSGDTVVVLGDFRNTFNATGKVATGPFVHVFTLGDGLISGWRGFEDTASDLQAAS
jgi:ketosteroid isomerase-like protein